MVLIMIFLKQQKNVLLPLKLIMFEIKSLMNHERSNYTLQ